MDNPEIGALVDAWTAIKQELVDLEGKVNSGTVLSSGDFAAIHQITTDMDAMLPVPPPPAPAPEPAPAPAPEPSPSPATSGDVPPASPGVTG